MNYASTTLLLLALACLAACELNPQRLAVVDQDGRRRNYLVRGNLPIDGERKFQMQELREQLERLTGLHEYELVVISFLNFLTAKETRNRYIEEKFFERNPEAGQLTTKIILGSLIDPFSCPAPLLYSLQLLGSLFDLDGLESFISELHEQIHEKGRNRILFMHCSAGMDRTGLVAGAYKLKYMKYSMRRVLEENSKFGGERKQMHLNTLNGLKWYCLALKGSQEHCQTQ